MDMGINILHENNQEIHLAIGVAIDKHKSSINANYTHY
jgi:hypothetical protein